MVLPLLTCLTHLLETTTKPFSSFYSVLLLSFFLSHFFFPLYMSLSLSIQQYLFFFITFSLFFLWSEFFISLSYSFFSFSLVSFLLFFSFSLLSFLLFFLFLSPLFLLFFSFSLLFPLFLYLSLFLSLILSLSCTLHFFDSDRT